MGSTLKSPTSIQGCSLSTTLNAPRAASNQLNLSQYTEPQAAQQFKANQHLKLTIQALPQDEEPTRRKRKQHHSLGQPGRDQTMLSNRQEVKTSIQSKITMSKPTTDIKDLDSKMMGRTRPRILSPPYPQMPENQTPKPFFREFRLHKKPFLGKNEVLPCFCLQFLRDAPLNPINHTCITAMETGPSH